MLFVNEKLPTESPTGMIEHEAQVARLGMMRDACEVFEQQPCGKFKDV